MTTTATPPAADPVSGRLSHQQILWVIFGLLMGMLLAALDQTIVTTAMRTIADELHGQTAQAWITTAYLITSTAATPLYGKLSDIYGRKPLYLTAISIFVVGSLLCGLAQSIYELAAYRAVQGLGAGGLFSVALAIVADIVAPRERGRYMGYFMAVFGLSSVAGPVVGGFFAGVDSFLTFSGWRWVFLINVPVGLIALFVVSRVLNLPHHRVDHRVDYWGALTLTVGLVPLLIVAEQGREWGWTSRTSLLMYAVGAVGVILFLIVEWAMGDEALVPLRLFRNGAFSLINVIMFVTGMGMFGGLLVLPLYLQIVRGYSPTSAGLLSLPMTFGMMTAMAVSNVVITRFGRYKILPIIGSAVMTVALFLSSNLKVETPMWQVGLLMVLLGMGLGMCMQTLMLAVQTEAGPRDMGVATATGTFTRQIGGTVGAAVFMSVLFSVVGNRIAEAFERNAAHVQAALTDPAVLSDPANAAVIEMLQTGNGANADLDDTSFLSSLDERLARPFLEGFASAMDTVFAVTSAITLLAFVLMWFVRERPLPSKSGLEMIAEEEAAAEAASASGNAPAATDAGKSDAEITSDGEERVTTPRT